MGFGGASQPATGLALRYLPVQHFFMTIATTLGTGILALPVKLSTAGLGPLALTLSVVLIGQISATLLMVELCQRAQLDVYSIHGEEQPVSLHLLSRLYLRRGDGALFTWAVLLHLVSILVSYLLAGSVSVGSLLGLDPSLHAWLLAPYAFILTAFLLKFYHGLTKVVSFLTAAKLCLILVMMGVTASLTGQGTADGSTGSVGPGIPAAVSDWHITSVLHPFLIATVALGGVVNVMPIMAGQIPRPAAWSSGVGSSDTGGTLAGVQQPVSQAMAAYKQAMANLAAAVCSGLVVCWALNLLWAWLILSLVPQTIEGAIAAGLPKTISLEAASKAGQISTVPLVALIRLRHPSLSWVATSVSVFMAVSISVSYIVMGSGLRNLVDGLAGHWSGNTDSRDTLDDRGGRRGALRDPSPLLLRPANTLSVSAALTLSRPALQGLPHTQSGYNAQWALSVKDTAGGTGLDAHPASSAGRRGAAADGIPGAGGGGVRDDITLPGARSVGADVEIAAAGILARMAEEEAQLSLMLAQDEDGDEEGQAAAGDHEQNIDMVEIDLEAVGGPGAYDRTSVDTTGHRNENRRRDNSGSGQDSRAEQAQRAESPLVRWLQKWFGQATHVAQAIGRSSRIVFLPVILTWRWGRSFLAHRAPWLFREPGLRYALYVCGYGLCFVLAQAQPHGFLTALEVFTSLALNLSCGYYIATMICNARRAERGLVALPPLLEYQAGASGTPHVLSPHGLKKGQEDAWEYWKETATTVAQEQEGLLQAASQPPLIDQPIPPAEAQVQTTHASAGLVSRTPRGGSSPALMETAAEQTTARASPVAMGPDSADFGPVHVVHGTTAVTGAGERGVGQALASPWTLSSLPTACLPLLAWSIFACAIVYDVVETLARAMPWTPAILTTALLCVAGQFTGLTCALQRALYVQAGEKPAPLGGLTSVLLWTAACGLAGAAGVPFLPALLLFFIPVMLCLAANAAASSGATGWALLTASAGTGSAVTCAMVMSMPNMVDRVQGVVDGPARLGLACALAWLAVCAHTVLMLKAVLRVATRAA